MRNYAIFVAKTRNYDIFVAKIYDYALIDSFWGSAGFLDSPASYATLTSCHHWYVFFYFWKEMQWSKGHLKYGGVPSVWGGEGDSEEKLFWRGPVRKYVPNACSWELLVWSGVIWGRFGVISVILECRIIVFYKMFVRFVNVYSL